MNLTISNQYFRSIIPPIDEGYVIWPFVDPPRLKPFSFEIFDVEASRKWWWNNWTLSLHISLLYLILICLGRRWMRDRPPLNLRFCLTLWNFSLAGFSTLALVRTIPEMYYVLNRPNGFYSSVCVRDELNPSSAWWAMAFAVSKLIELFDTFFIVARKTPLIFLHWYHHMMTLIVCFLSYPQAEPIFRYVGAMNLFVHSIMYTYYGFKAMRFQPPRKLAMLITFLQLSQMAIGLFVNFYAIYIKSIGVECARSKENTKVQLWVYASYFALFLNYFHQSYFSKSKRTKGD